MSVSELLSRGRACYARNEWNDAFEALSQADRSSPLAAEDLHRLAWSAGLTGRDEAMLSVQERTYNALLEANQQLPAARAAFWLGFRLFAVGEPARGGGWLNRAQRLIEAHAQECAEQGYMLITASFRHMSLDELVEAQECARRAVIIGERFAERDLIALGLNLQGRALLAQGRVDPGLALLDEAMVAATSGELSPVVTGLVYCSSIGSCHRIFALDRVREWTVALTTFCDANPQLGLFTGACLVHRAEVMELSGSWPEAVDEARRAVERCARGLEPEAAGRAHYQQAEIHRLRGEFALADAAYREANRCGFEPLPGLALLRLAEGDVGAAASASRRVVGATREPLARTRFLPAHVDIMLASGDLEEARAASRELQQSAATLNTEVLVAIAARACAAVHLADGRPHDVIEPARRAFVIWQQLGAPYLAARLRVLIGRACVALEDAHCARLELDCALEVFEQLGAEPDVVTVKALLSGRTSTEHGLTERELQVLRLVATGKTNKAIARELSLSEKTIDRHLSNIFVKLNVPSRAAATAFAYEHKLT